ncbi:uncharacterized protein METZ01_LOCUS124280 [marine metagenome]|uniref:Uncharacterized protein n=1 Tax=marine metagenome TaxID=408172 RepID=A0A381Y2V6_9ZZZZ
MQRIQGSILKLLALKILNSFQATPWQGAL